MSLLVNLADRFEDQIAIAVERLPLLVAIVLAITCLIEGGGLVYLATRPSIPPYIAVIRDGRIAGYANVFAAAQTWAPAIIEDHLKRFIYAVRSVGTDHDLELHQTDLAYAMAGNQAYQIVDNYLRDPGTDPIKLGYHGDYRDADPIHCLQEPDPKLHGHTWQCEWTEKDHPPLGLVTTHQMQALVIVTTGKPQPKNELNPLGIYITSIMWQQTQ